MKVIHCELSSEFKTIEVYPLSDLHVGAKTTDYTLFKKFIKHILQQPNRFIVYNGDNMNNATKNSVSNVYGEIMRPREQKKWLIENLEPVKDRILVFVEGNHEARNTKETDQSVVEDIAYALGKSELYREDEAYLKLSFGRNIRGKRQTYGVYLTHGSGGGGTPGAALNKIVKLPLSVTADIYIIGHVHKMIGHRDTYRDIDMRNCKVVNKDRLYVISSHWQDFGGYAAKKMLTPGAKGSVPITISGTEKDFWAKI